MHLGYRAVVSGLCREDSFLGVIHLFDAQSLTSLGYFGPNESGLLEACQRKPFAVMPEINESDMADIFARNLSTVSRPLPHGWSVWWIFGL